MSVIRRLSYGLYLSQLLNVNRLVLFFPSLPLSLSRFLLLNSVSTRSFDFSRNSSRNIGVSRLVVRRNYLCRGKSRTWGLTRLKDFICYFRYDDITNFFLSSILGMCISIISQVVKCKCRCIGAPEYNTMRLM